MIRFRVFGAFRAELADGMDVTPRSRKACGLLALLLSASDYRCSRDSLMDKLWSDRAPDQARASLRTTLSEIRKTLADEGKILSTDMWQVSLVSTEVEIVDADAGDSGRQYLDGIGVKDPEFENWLRDRRHQLEGTSPQTNSSLSNSTAPVLLLALPHPEAPKSIFADFLKNSISKTISDWGPVDVRWEGQTGLLDPTQQIYRLETIEQQVGNGIALQAQLTSPCKDVVLWQVADMIPIGKAHSAIEDVSRLTNRCVDQTMAVFAGSHHRNLGHQSSSSYQVMQGMLKSQGEDYDECYAEYAKKFDQDGRGIHLAWQGFLSCWAVGERHRRDLEDVRADARDLMRRAISLEPHNSIVYALASHIFGFVLSEYEVAGEMAHRSVTLDKTNPFGWAFLGIAKLNLNRGEEAFENIMYARRICGDGPHRAFIDSLTVQIGILTGHSNEVFAIGEALCAIRPNYSSPLRHLIAGYLTTNEYEKAERCAIMLNKKEHDISLELFKEPDYPVHALRKSGVLDLKHLPKLI